MGMNVKSAHTHEVFKRIVRLTGQSQEAAVREAGERYLRELELEDTARVLREDAAEIGVLIGLKPGDDPTDELYDDDGLPR